MSLTKKENEAKELIVGQVEKALVQFVNFCHDYCKENAVSQVPISVLEEAKSIMLKSFKEGSKG